MQTLDQRIKNIEDTSSMDTNKLGHFMDAFIITQDEPVLKNDHVGKDTLERLQKLMDKESYARCEGIVFW